MKQELGDIKIEFSNSYMLTHDRTIIQTHDIGELHQTENYGRGILTIIEVHIIVLILMPIMIETECMILDDMMKHQNDMLKTVQEGTEQYQQI